MCGICGFNWEDRKLVKSMADAILHRGPDGHGYHVDKNISLGHRRLSIIDLSVRGKQPMYNEDGTICIVFNGEIYNYKELRQKLENKYKFFSGTDTEAIIHAYEEYGEECLQYLNGMFAFAIWDSKKKRLFLARDRLGIKPLYYYHKDGKFIFASEIKAILKHNIQKKVNPYALNDFFTFSYIPYPNTLFQDIYKLAPAHYMVLSGKKLQNIELKKYWEVGFDQVSNNNAYSDEGGYAKQLLSRFKKAVEMQLMSDVPIGAYLSGGMDSSSIVAVMSTLLDKPVTTFSVGFESDEVINELYYAKKVAQKLGTDHNEIIVTPEDAIKAFPKVIYHLDEPIANPASIPLYYMSKAAKKKMTVVLTGNGGDELFAGYRQHKVISLTNFYYNKFPSIFDSKITQGLINIIDKNLSGDNRLKKYSEFSAKFLKAAKDPATAYKILMYKNFSDEEKNMLLQASGNPGFSGKGSSLEFVESFFKTKNHILNQLTEIDLRLLLPENYLMVDDKINMANSVESRVPFLDHTFVEFAAKIPASLKLHGLTGKYILKKAMKKLLPREIIKRKKYGFTPPMTEWVNKHLRSEAQDVLLHNNEIKKYFNAGYLDKILSDPSTKHYNKVLPLLMFGYWHNQFING